MMQGTYPNTRSSSDQRERTNHHSSASALVDKGYYDIRGYKNRAHITPLRYKSLSRERLPGGRSSQQNEGMLMSPQNTKPSSLEFVSFREPHQVPQTTRPPLYFGYLDQSPPTLAGGPPIDLSNQVNSLRTSLNKRLSSSNDLQDLREMVKAVKEEQKVYIDHELKMALNTFKNDVFEQQYGFERQICNLINSISSELKSRKLNQEAEEREAKEAQKLQKAALDDIGSLQKWVNTIVDGVEKLKDSQEVLGASLGSELKSIKEELEKVHSDERQLQSLEEQIQELHKLITEGSLQEAKGPSQDEFQRLQQSSMQAKNMISKLQEQLDNVHRLVVDKADKESSDSNFLVQQNEVDNLKLKVRINESKSLQMEESLKQMVSQNNEALISSLQKGLKQINTELLMQQSKIQGLDDFISGKVNGYDLAIAAQQKVIDELKRKDHTLLATNATPAMLEQLREEIMPLLQELSSKAIAQVSEHLKLSQKFLELENESKQEQQQLAQSTKQSIDALKQQILQFENSLTQKLEETNTHHLKNSEAVTQKISQQEQDLKKRIGESIKQMMGLRMEIEGLKAQEAEIQEIKVMKVETSKKMKTHAEQIRQQGSNINELKEYVDQKLKDTISYTQHENSLKQLEQTLKSEQARGNELKVSIEELQGELATLKQQINTDITQITKRDQQLEGRVNNMNEGLNDLIDQMVRQAGDIESLKASMKKPAENADSQQQIAALKQQNEDMELRLEQLLKQSVQQLEVQIGKLNRKFDDQINNSELKIGQLQDTVNEQLSKIQQIGQQLSAHKSEMNEAMQLIKTANEQILTKLKETTTKSLAELEHKMSCLQSSHDILKVTQNTQQQQIEAILEQNQSYLTLQEELKKESERLNLQINELIEKIEGMSNTKELERTVNQMKGEMEIQAKQCNEQFKEIHDRLLKQDQTCASNLEQYKQAVLIFKRKTEESLEQTLNGFNHDLQAVKDDHTNSRMELLQQSLDTRTKVCVAQRDIEDIYQKLQVHQSEHDKLQENFNQLIQSTLKTLENGLLQKIAKSDTSSQNALKEIIEKINTVQNELKDLRASAEKENASKREQLRMVENELHRLQEETLPAQASNITQVMNECDETLAGKILKVEEQLAVIPQTIENESQRLTQVREKIQPLEKEIDELRAFINALDQRMDQLQEAQQLTSNNNQSSLAELKPEIEELEERLHSKHQSLAEKFNGLQENVYGLIQQQSQPKLSPEFAHKEDLQFLNNKIEQQSREFTALHQSGIDKLKNEMLEEIYSQIQVLAKLCDVQKQDQERMQRDIQSINGSLGQMALQMENRLPKDQLEPVKKDISSVKQDIEQLKQLISNNGRQNDEIKEYFESKLSQQSIILENQKDISVQEEESLRNVIERLENEVSSYQQQFNNFQQAVQLDLTKKVDDNALKNALEEREVIHKQEHNQLQQAIQDLQTKMAQELAKVNESLAMKVQHSEFDQEISSLKEYIQKLLDEQAKNCLAKQNQLSIRIEELIMEDGKLSFEIQKQQSKCDKLEQIMKAIDLDPLLDSQKQTHKQIAALQLKNEELSLELEKLKMHLPSIEEKLEAMAQNQNATKEELLANQEASSQRVGQAVQDLVQSMTKLEDELNKKIVQLRQILEQVKAVKHRTDKQLEEIQMELNSQKELQESLQSDQKTLREQQALSENKFGGELRQLREKLNQLLHSQQEPHEASHLNAVADPDLIERINTVDAKNDQAQNAIDQIKQEVEGLKNQNKEIKTNEEKIASALKIVNDDTKRFADDMNNTIKALQEKIASMKVIQTQLAQDLSGLQQKTKENQDNESKMLKQLEDRISQLEQNPQVEMLQKNVEEVLQNLQDQIQEISEVVGVNHEPRIAALESLKEDLSLLKQDLMMVDSESKQRDLEMKVLIDQNDEDLREFCQNVIKDMEYMEQKLIEALQRDTIAIIAQEELDPIKIRLNKLEGATSSHSPSRNLGNIMEESADAQSSATKHWLQEHQRLLDDMRRRRLFYLRKTPMDQRIEELMKQHGCSQQEALRLYQEELERHRCSVLSNIGNTFSPYRSRGGQKGRDVSEDQQQQQRNSFFQSIYQNIVDKISPSRQQNGSQPRRDNSQESPEIDAPWNKNLSTAIRPSDVQQATPNINRQRAAPDQQQIGVAPFDSNNHPLKRNTTGNFDDANLDAEDLDDTKGDIPQYIEENLTRMSVLSPNKQLPLQYHGRTVSDPYHLNLQRFNLDQANNNERGLEPFSMPPLQQQNVAGNKRPISDRADYNNVRTSKPSFGKTSIVDNSQVKPGGDNIFENQQLESQRASKKREGLHKTPKFDLSS